MPSATTTRMRGSASISASRCGRQLAISSGVGLLSGGAHRTAAAMNASLKRQAVVRMLRGRDVGEAGAMERGHQEVARAADAVAGEHAAGPVGAVGGRRQADDQQPRAADRRSRAPAAPSRSSSRKARRFSRPTALAVLAQARAALARDDRLAGRRRAAESHVASRWHAGSLSSSAVTISGWPAAVRPVSRDAEQLGVSTGRCARPLRRNWLVRNICSQRCGRARCRRNARVARLARLCAAERRAGQSRRGCCAS